MAKQDRSADVEGAPESASAADMIAVRWTPAPGNKTSERTIEPYTWTPGAVVPVERGWWNTYEIALRTSPRETFEPVPADAA